MDPRFDEIFRRLEALEKKKGSTAEEKPKQAPKAATKKGKG